MACHGCATRSPHGRHDVRANTGHGMQLDPLPLWRHAPCPTCDRTTGRTGRCRIRWRPRRNQSSTPFRGGRTASTRLLQDGVISGDRRYRRTLLKWGSWAVSPLAASSRTSLSERRADCPVDLRHGREGHVAHGQRGRPRPCGGLGDGPHRSASIGRNRSFSSH